MKKYFPVFLTALSFQLAALSQNIGIGTTNPQNKLHVAGGLRLDTLVGVGGNGILIHDALGAVYGLKLTGNVGDVLRGDGTFGAGSSGGGSGAVWMLNGNSATDPTTDFIGTTDGQPVLFRVNNLFAGIIDAENTAFGLSALSQARVYFASSRNTAFGSGSLQSDVDGSYNAAHGYNALANNISGNYNTANGAFALRSSGGSYNTANGYSALISNTAGNYNTATGHESLYFNTTGNNNTANGNQALAGCTTGSYNTASGYRALYSNSTADGNTATGSQALYFTTTGVANTASGESALLYNTGSYNTGMGVEALYHTTAAQYNTAIGYHAGFNHDLGYNNTFLGANTNANANDLFNCIAIGQGVTCTASSQARIGNSATNSIGGQVGWTTLSDERMKTNVRENVKGIEFIKLLRPVTYNVDANKVDDWLKKDQTEKNKNISARANEIMQKARNEKSKTVYTGFLAQDVAAAAKKIGYDFSGVDAPKNNSDLYGLRYGEFVVPLVKAVQEQQAVIEKQQQQIDELIKQLQLIKDKLK